MIDIPIAIHRLSQQEEKVYPLPVHLSALFTHPPMVLSDVATGEGATIVTTKSELGNLAVWITGFLVVEVVVSTSTSSFLELEVGFGAYEVEVTKTVDSVPSSDSVVG